MLREPRALALAAAIAVVAPAGAAVAGDWEIEIHGGGLWTLTPSSGQATRPPPGENFQTVVPGVSSRHHGRRGVARRPGVRVRARSGYVEEEDRR